MLSYELQLGKAAEHLVVCDLILQGHNAFLADQGLPFDIVVAEESKLLRVQVKSTATLQTTIRNKHPHYRFGLRRAKKGARTISASECDLVAFVVLPLKMVGYLPISDLRSKRHGGMVMAVDFYVRSQDTRREIRDDGKRCGMWGRILDDYATFPSAKERLSWQNTS